MYVYYTMLFILLISVTYAISKAKKRNKCPPFVASDLFLKNVHKLKRKTRFCPVFTDENSFASVILSRSDPTLVESLALLFKCIGDIAGFTFMPIKKERIFRLWGSGRSFRLALNPDRR